MDALIPTTDLPVLDEGHTFIQVNLPFAQEGDHRVTGTRIHEFDATESGPQPQDLHVA